jgi:hypothetical protein
MGFAIHRSGDRRPLENKAVFAQTDEFGSTDRTMVAQVPVRDVATAYTLFGLWLDWLCLVEFLYIVARVLVARRQIG